MVENQRPLEVPLGPEPGVTVSADRLAMSYKRAFRKCIANGEVKKIATSTADVSKPNLAICW